MRLISNSGAAFSLRLDDQIPPLEEGLRFQDAVFRPAAVTAAPRKARRSAPDAVSVTMGMNVARIVFASHILVVLLLAIMVFSLVFVGVRASNSMNYYYRLTQPYLEELRDRGMHMVRNADESSIKMAHLAREADGMVSIGVPALSKTLNESMAAVDRLVQLARHPVLKLSVE